MRKTVLTLLFISTIGLGAACAVSRFFADRTAPQIAVPTADLTYVEGEPLSNLLYGVSAYDNKDGDLSSSVRIYDIAVTNGGTEALVTYAVYDYSNNLAKVSKLVKYVNADDKTSDSDNKKEEKEEKPAEEKKEKPTEKPTETPTTEATTEDEGYKDPEMVSTGAPVIKLKTHEVTLPKGANFEPTAYVEQIIDDKDLQDDLYHIIHVDGGYDMNTDGTYELTYYIVDSDGNQSNKAKLKLVVAD